MPMQEANGITIHYNLHEPKSTRHARRLAVLVNGLADDQSTWDPQIPALNDAGYAVLCFDNRGVGKTSRPSGPYTAELLADDLHALLLVLGVKQFHIVGISMGGMILQSYALKYANHSSSAQGLTMLSLSLCCTYAEPTSFCSRMFALWAEMAAKMSVQDVMRDVILWCFTVPYFREREEELAEIDSAMAALDVGLAEYLAQLNVIQIFDSRSGLLCLKDQHQVLGGLDNGKVLVLAGEQDILIPTQLSRELHAMIPGAVWKTVKGGHCCALEFASDFNETLLSFLTSVST